MESLPFLQFCSVNENEMDNEAISIDFESSETKSLS